MLKKILFSLLTSVSLFVYAEEAQITGTVVPKCVINVDVPGVYGNPTPNALSTLTDDGGVAPIVRFDIVQPGYYKAKITAPENFSSSPTLSDSVSWTGTTVVDQVTDAEMSVFTDTKVSYDNVTEFDLTVGGSVWFKTDSTVTYGVNKAFPAGTYTSVVVAECIAK